jgi:transketolase
MENQIDNNNLEKTAKKIRLETFKAITNAGGGHFGGCMSIIEILTVLYFKILKIDPKKPKDRNRDIFILSKGHGGPALYTTLAVRGFFPTEDLKDLDRPLSKFPKHIDRLKLDGIEASTGALGQGLSIACGMALSLKYRNKNNYVYILLGDGELNSGQVWEAVMTASKYKLDNIIAIVDRNNCQIDGPSEEVMPMEPLEKKFRDFGWKTISVGGHNIKALLDIFKESKDLMGKPKIIIANTIKGCGLSLMENDYAWHSGSLNPEQLSVCLADLGVKND